MKFLFLRIKKRNLRVSSSTDVKKDLPRGVARIFQRWGHTVPKRGFSPDFRVDNCALYLQIQFMLGKKIFQNLKVTDKSETDFHFSRNKR